MVGMYIAKAQILIKKNMVREAIKNYQKAVKAQSLIENDGEKMAQVQAETQNALEVYNQNVGFEKMIENLEDLSDEEGTNLMTDFQPQLEHSYASSPLQMANPQAYLNAWRLNMTKK